MPLSSTYSRKPHKGSVDSALPEMSMSQVGEVESDGPHLEDMDFRSSINSARVCVRDPQRRGQDREFIARRRVVVARDGASVLPYFQSAGRWKIVLVEQYRIAVGKATLEAPGGVVENKENVLKTMARELEEEAGIKVDPDQIELRFREIYLPSLLNGRAWGGIVEIDQESYPDLEVPTLQRERESGRDSYTVRRVFFLDEILELRGISDLDILDLWTSRLISEVAVATRTPRKWDTSA